MRPPRICFVGGIYHVTVRCNNQEFMFKDDEDFKLFLKILLIAKVIYGVSVFGYCLTNNHVHLIVGTPNEANLSRFMQYVNGNFAKAYNRKHGRTGRFWGGRFHSTVIESEEQFFNTLAYVELNMVRCGAVSHPGDWRWSSYHAHAYGANDTVIDFYEMYLALAQTPEKRRELYRTMIAESMGEKGLTHDPVYSNGVILGSEKFVSKIVSEYGAKVPYYYKRKIYPTATSFSLYRPASSLGCG